MIVIAGYVQKSLIKVEAGKKTLSQEMSTKFELYRVWSSVPSRLTWDSTPFFFCKDGKYNYQFIT